MGSKRNQQSAEEKAAAEVNDMFDETSEEQEEDEFDFQTGYSSNNSTIHGFSSVEKGKVYEILYMTKDFPLFRFTDKDQKDRVMLLKEIFGKRNIRMYYAPCSVNYKKVLRFIMENGAYLKSFGKKESKNKKKYFDIKVKTLEIAQHEPPTKEELIERATKVQKAIESEKA